MEGKHIKDLMEAYLQMYAPKEEIEEGKSSRPRYPGGRGVLDQERRDEKREASAENMRGHTAGPGTVTKNPKKLRKQKAMGELGEAVKGESSDRRKALAAERRAGIKPLSAKEGEKYASHKISQMAYAKRAKMGEELDIFDVVLEFLQAEGYAETLEEAEWMMANVIDEEAIAIILGEEELDEASRRDEFTRAAIARNSGKKGGITFEPGPNWDASANRGKGAHISPKQKEKQRRKALRQEEYMDEAQAARENPEKYEREQSKKYAPVRGERTPMPPRGDKRREDFEKWYAKNVR